MRHLSLKEKAYELIKQKILNYDFEPGSRIMEDELAKEISMSRTPVREAINQLSAEGFINNIPRKGIYFTTVTKKELKDLLEIRIVLESLAIRKCIENITPKGIDMLEKDNEEFREAYERSDYKKCNQLDSKFHRDISLISNNIKLIKFSIEVEEFMLIARGIEKKTLTQEKNELTLQDHIEILDLIKKKETDKAIKAISKNIQRMKINLEV